nr:MAG: hypothetical protein [Bacteriophage sp.]
MEKHKKIIIVFILIFVHVLLTQYVYFCPERSIIFGRVKTIANMVTEIKRNPNEHKKSLDSRSSAPLFLSIIITIWKSENHNIYTKNLVICKNIEEKQLARKDLSGDDSVPVYSYGNMV